MHVIQLLVTL